MLERAIQKLKTEMQQNQNNGYIQFVGQALIDYIKDIPSAAAAIMADGKTIAKSLEAMSAEAKKKPRIGNMAMLTPDEGIKIVLQYFGINSPCANDGGTSFTPTHSENFDIKLEDLL
ncbi:MAG: hypothetical protein ABFD25_20970 [Clostridiaceae bacterium]